MSHLDIYDPSTKPVEPPPPSVISKIKIDICEKISDTRQYCAGKEALVLDTVHPVTQYIPVSYDTAKRFGVIGVCTLSGILQGRRRGAIRRYMYPAVGLLAGCSACYPKQTYYTGSKVLTTSLPLIAVAGKSTVEFTSSAIHQGKVFSAFAYEKYKEAFPEQAYEAPPEVPNVPLKVVIPSVDVLEAPGSVDVEKVESVSEDEAAAIDAAVSEADAISESESSEEVTDQVLTLERLVLPEEVPPIQGDLGMGDEDHDDMYSTRSARA